MLIINLIIAFFVAGVILFIACRLTREIPLCLTPDLYLTQKKYEIFIPKTFHKYLGRLGLMLWGGI